MEPLPEDLALLYRWVDWSAKSMLRTAGDVPPIGSYLDGEGVVNVVHVNHRPGESRDDTLQELLHWLVEAAKAPHVGAVCYCMAMGLRNVETGETRRQVQIHLETADGTAVQIHTPFVGGLMGEYSFQEPQVVPCGPKIFPLARGKSEEERQKRP